MNKFILVIVAVLLVNCGENPITPTPEGILNTPQALELLGRSYKLETYLWRAFGSIGPPDETPLIALVKLVALDSLSIPQGFSVSHLWVINGPRTWSTKFSNEQLPPSPDFVQEKIARGGPKWGPGVSVEVVVELRVPGGKTCFIRATGQPIHAVY